MKTNKDDKIHKGKLSFLTDYHTMAKEHLDDYPDVDRYEGNGVIALKSDLRKMHPYRAGLPKEFEQVDCIFGAVPWRNEYKGFHERANAGQGDWNHRMFVMRIGDAVISSGVPAVIFISKFSGKDMPPPMQEETVTVGGMPCQAMVYYTTIPNLAGMTENEVLQALAKAYNCVGDFICGYGLSGRLFVEAGKQTVMADFNGKCIGYIEEHAPEWGKSKV